MTREWLFSLSLSKKRQKKVKSRDGPFRPQYTFLVAGGAFHAGTSPALVFSFILGQWVKKFAVLIHLGSTVTEGNSTTFKDKE